MASPELGAFFIKLNLQATAGAHEPSIHFECVFGTTTTQICKVFNFSKARVDFSVKVTEGIAEFQLLNDRFVYSVQPGSITSPSEQAIEVQFDPCQLGEFRGKVVATSPVAGRIPLFVHRKLYPTKTEGTLHVHGQWRIDAADGVQESISAAMHFQFGVFKSRISSEGRYGVNQG